MTDSYYEDLSADVAKILLGDNYKPDKHYKVYQDMYEVTVVECDACTGDTTPVRLDTCFTPNYVKAETYHPNCIEVLQSNQSLHLITAYLIAASIVLCGWGALLSLIK